LLSYGIFYMQPFGNLVVLWHIFPCSVHILCQEKFGNLVVCTLAYFPLFGILCQEKSGNPGTHQTIRKPTEQNLMFNIVSI
jgi:hypothetical protein